MAKEVLNNNHVGLTLGIFLALWHAVWAFVVALGFGQRYLDMILPMHFLNNIYSVMLFSPLKALGLVLMAFVCGYIMGWIFAAIWNGVKRYC